jgi:hypothetical protein
MNTLHSLLDSVHVEPRHRALLLWALILAASVLSAFVFTVQQTLERRGSSLPRVHAEATHPSEEFVLANASLATAR